VERVSEFEKEVARLNQETEELLRGLTQALRALSRDLEALEGRVGRKRYALSLGFAGDEGLAVVAGVKGGDGRLFFPSQLQGEEAQALEPLFAKAAGRVRRFRLALEEEKARVLRLLEEVGSGRSLEER
jgi:hypothetical protein